MSDKYSHKESKKYNHSKDNKEQRDLIKLSMSLSRMLRHRAEDMGLNIKPDGYVKIADIIRVLKVDKKQIKTVVEHNQKHSKDRFSISPDGDYIRANQGHTMKSINAELFMNKIDDPSKVVPRNETSGKFECIHGTSYQRLGGNVKVIKDVKKEQEEDHNDETTGLSKMARQHVHFSKGMLDNKEVKSGMRNSSDIYIYCDLEASMASGLVFYESSNGVILTAGNRNGVVPSRFLRVEYK
jgi:2'-phosphotransferase